MTLHLVFDVYGTLVDPQGMAEHLRHDVGDAAESVSTLWRSKQLEFSFRRGLMRVYEDFAVCTRQALQTAMQTHDFELTPEREDALITAYLSLPGFADAGPALSQLGQYPRFAFSNGTPEAMEKVLGHNNLLEYFDGLVSVDAIKSFKPDPAVYAYARRATGAMTQPLCLVSSNGWDVIGALASGLLAIWVQRDPTVVFEDWGLQPNAIIRDLSELPAALEALDVS